MLQFFANIIVAYIFEESTNFAQNSNICLVIDNKRPRIWQIDNASHAEMRGMHA